MEMVDHIKGALKLKKKPNDKKCDFTITVGDDSIRVHRSKLRKVTDFFDKSYPQSFNDENNVCHETQATFETASTCVQVFYKKDPLFTLATVGPILTLARKWRMEDLQKKCNDYILGQINPVSCVAVKKMAQEIGDEDIEKLADNFILLNLPLVVEVREIDKLTEDEIKSIFNDYLGPFDDFGIPKLKEKDAVLWDLLTFWVKSRDLARVPLFCELLKVIPFSFFNVDLIQKKMLKEPLVAECSECTEYITKNLLDVLQHRIEFTETTRKFGMEEQYCAAEEAFFLHSVAQDHNYQDISETIEDYIKCNFSAIVVQAEFKELERNDLLRYLESAQTTPEIMWKAIITWIYHELPERAEHFQHLFQMIRLEDVPLDFIQKNMLEENLVNSSTECKDMILASILQRGLGTR